MRLLSLLPLLLTGCLFLSDADLAGRLDADGDGFVDARVGGDDCDDNDPLTYPGAQERCDGVDRDCDGVVDNQPVDGTLYWPDDDNDGYGDEQATPILACAAPPGFVANDLDCDDAAAGVHPDAAERCNGVDDNCDGLIDDADPAVIDASTWYFDGDGDGDGDASMPAVQCAAPPQHVANDLDCNDNDASLNQNTSWYPDVDEDGYGDQHAPATRQCEAPPGWLRTKTDCDDTNPAVNPGATEVCDGIDNDCDGRIDGAWAVDAIAWYLDADGDGFGRIDDLIRACNPIPGRVANGDDCDDQNPDIYPGAFDECYDGIDADCAGDNDFDCDGDGYVAIAYGGDDCDDDDPEVYPGVTRIVQVSSDDGDLQAAIDASCEGDVLELAPGTYLGAVWLRRGVTLRGAGPTTVLDGNDAGTTLTIESGYAERLTVRGGLAAQGGGVRVLDDVTTSLTALTIADNVALTLGGGLLVGRRAHVTLSDLVVRDNRSSDDGGGLTIDNDASVSANALLVEDNVATDDGGGLLIRNRVTFGADALTVRRNSSGKDGGGLYAINDAMLTITDSTWANNFAMRDGGGAYVIGQQTGSTSLTMTDAAFHNNQSGSAGSAFQLTSVTLDVADVLVADHDSSGVAGAINSSDGSVRDLTVRDNRGNVGSGLRVSSGGSRDLLTLERLTVVDNTANVGNAGLEIYQAIDVLARDLTVAGNTSTGNTVSLSVRDQFNAQLRVTNAVFADIDGQYAFTNAYNGTDLTIANSLIAGGRTPVRFDVRVANRLRVLDSVFVDTAGLAQVNSFAPILLRNVFWPLGPVTGGLSSPLTDPSNRELDPELARFNPALDRDLWDVYPLPGSPLINAGDPAALDADGTRLDIGPRGGALLDPSWYLDADNDSLPDGWERSWGTDPSVHDAADDPDGDGLNNLEELFFSTHPLLPDTDGDGTDDADELNAGTNPIDPRDG